MKDFDPRDLLTTLQKTVRLTLELVADEERVRWRTACSPIGSLGGVVHCWSKAAHNTSHTSDAEVVKWLTKMFIEEVKFPEVSDIHIHCMQPAS